ncbi:MAG: tRNA (guanosine(37)-N1)-methyltransferase TrmD [Candidatus Nanosyncoccaceae bacterium]|jgi:tRNA (guanine37-N1)-methyltransferase
MKLIQIITLFPEALEPYLNSSMLYKAQDIGVVKFRLINLRDFGLGKRKIVDDKPYGGGDGMLLKPEPLAAAIRDARATDDSTKVLLMTPRGVKFNQSIAEKLSKDESGLTLVCAHYEGYDERIVKLVDWSISLGNFVLTGGEIPALAITDAVVRLLPGVLGGETSAEIESFAGGTDLLEFPQYTRPEVWEGESVPEVLLSGHHGEIAKWRREQMISQERLE